MPFMLGRNKESTFLSFCFDERSHRQNIHIWREPIKQIPSSRTTPAQAKDSEAATTRKSQRTLTTSRTPSCQNPTIRRFCSSSRWTGSFGFSVSQFVEIAPGARREDSWTRQFFISRYSVLALSGLFHIRVIRKICANRSCFKYYVASVGCFINHSMRHYLHEIIYTHVLWHSGAVGTVQTLQPGCNVPGCYQPIAGPACEVPGTTDAVTEIQRDGPGQSWTQRGIRTRKTATQNTS